MKSENPPIFSASALLLGLLSWLLWSCALCALVLFVVVLLVFLFPFGDMIKERAHRVGASSLRGLWACYILVQLLKNSVAVALAFSSSSG